jgi:hypothetical protein
MIRDKEATNPKRKVAPYGTIVSCTQLKVSTKLEG